jgi:hypothetical protein
LRFSGDEGWRLAVELKLGAKFGHRQLERYADSQPVSTVVRDLSYISDLSFPSCRSTRTGLASPPGNRCSRPPEPAPSSGLENGLALPSGSHAVRRGLRRRDTPVARPISRSPVSPRIWGEGPQMIRPPDHAPTEGALTAAGLPASHQPGRHAGAKLRAVCARNDDPGACTRAASTGVVMLREGYGGPPRSAPLEPAAPSARAILRAVAGVELAGPYCGPVVVVHKATCERQCFFR